MNTLDISTTYGKQEWKKKIEAVDKAMDKASAILNLIEQADQRMLNEIDTAQTYGYWFPDLKKRAMHRADISRRAALRLRESFNNLINEIQL